MMDVDAPDRLEREASCRLRLRLLTRIHRSYQTIEQTLQVGPLAIAFTRPADPNVALNNAVAAEAQRDRQTGRSHSGDEIHLPYWAQLWDSSLGMGVFMVRQWAQMHAPDQDSAVAKLARNLMRQGQAWRPPTVRPPQTPRFPTGGAARARVLDLGCGMGLTGAVAARLGAAVTFADLEPWALIFSRLNSLSDRAHCHYRRLNWRTDRLTQRFDLILGADVLYERQQWEPLDAFFQHHLADGGAVLLGEPGRVTGDDYPAWIAQRPWGFDRFDQSLPGGRPIRIFQLTRKSRPA